MAQMLNMLILISISMSGFGQITINKITLPGELKYGTDKMVLNGAGTRTKMIFKLYTAGLYLDTKSDDADEIINTDKPMAIRMVITSNKINSDNMSEAIREGFDKSTNSNTKHIEGRIDRLIETFRSEPIEVGNEFDIVYSSDKKVNVFRNGKLKSTVEGFDFKTALFGIWLSGTPVQAGLKNGLLGK